LPNEEFKPLHKESYIRTLERWTDLDDRLKTRKRASHVEEEHGESA
jgi:hypothetical protein